MEQELKDLFDATSRLAAKYKVYNKKFTLDGKLVGDIGEVLVAESYNLELYPDNTHHADGFVKGHPDKEVQIKSSFNNYFYYPKDIKNVPAYFIAIHINPDGSFEEVYNGKSELIYKRLLSHLPTERKYPYRLSTKKLRELNLSEENNDKIKTSIKT